MLSFREFILREADIIYKSADSSEKIIQRKLRPPKIDTNKNISKADSSIKFKIKKPRIKKPKKYK